MYASSGVVPDVGDLRTGACGKRGVSTLKLNPQQSVKYRWEQPLRYKLTVSVVSILSSCMYVSSFIGKNMACQNASIYKKSKGIKLVCINSRLRNIANKCILNYY